MKRSRSKEDRVQRTRPLICDRCCATATQLALNAEFTTVMAIDVTRAIRIFIDLTILIVILSITNLLAIRVIGYAVFTDLSIA